MKLLINYADEPWKPAQHYATHKAYSVGKVDKVIEYGPENIDEEFRKKMQMHLLLIISVLENTVYGVHTF